MIRKICVYLFFLTTMIFNGNPLQANTPTKIKAIVFDFGSVIAKTDKEEVAQFIAESFNISQEEALQSLNQLKMNILKGQQEDDFWIDYAKSHSIALPNNWIAKLNEKRSIALKPISGMLDLVKNLHRQGFQIALLSNVRESQAKIKRELGYYEFFNPVILSYKVGLSKPDPKIFYLLLKQLNLSADQVLFIDNKEVNIKAAQSIGIDGIEFINREQLIKALAERGLQVN